MGDNLKIEKCNKSHCKTCIFHPDVNKRIDLSESRVEEITLYLSTFKSSHICHQTNKTCYGGLELQASILFGLGIISDKKVETMLNEASKFIVK